MTQRSRNASISEHLEGLVDQLHEEGRLRVWSIAITIFGDAVVLRGGIIGLTALQEIMAKLRIEANAVRTAMSRLTKDGWLIRDKTGRQSYYSLAQEGQASFESATRRIYAANSPDWTGEFEIVLAPENDMKAKEKRANQMKTQGYGSPLSGVYIRPITKQNHGTRVIRQDDVLVSMIAGEINSISLSEFSGQCWPMEELERDYLRFSKRYQPMLHRLQNSQNPDTSNFAPLDALALRVLLIHDWRRLVLRDADLPKEFRPEGWPGENAREITRQLYSFLLTASEQWLDMCFTKDGNALPQASAQLYERF